MEHLLSANSPCSGDIVGKQPRPLPLAVWQGEHTMKEQ